LSRHALGALLGDLSEELARRQDLGRTAGAALWLEWRAWTYVIKLTPALVGAACRRGLDELGQDVRGALRAHRTSPGLTVAVIILLAAGIGITTAVAAVVYGVLLRPLPVTHESGLVGLYSTDIPLDRWRDPVSGIRVEHWRTRTDLFDGIATSTRARFDVMLDGVAERIDGEAVSDNFFELLGPPVLRGRIFTGIDTASAAGAVPCVISERLWRRAFAADPGAIGRPLLSQTLAFTVVGVVPDAFGRWRAPADIWIPYRLAPSLLPPKALTSDLWRLFGAVGRIRPEVRIEHARAMMTSFDATLDEPLTFQVDQDRGVEVVPLRDANPTAAVRQSLMLVAALTVLVVAVVTANVAGLLLARSLSRRREMALRRAIGATTSRLVRQVMTEAAVLGVVGGGLGVFLASRTTPALLAIAPAQWRSAIVTVDMPVLIFAVIVILAVVVTVGALPAVRTGSRTAAGLRIGGHASAGPESLRAQSLLVGTQTAVALPVVLAAAMLGVGFAHLHASDPGFDAKALLTAEVGLPPSYASSEEAVAFHERLVERISTVPGVGAVAIGTSVVRYLHERQAIPRGVSIWVEGGRGFLNGEADHAPFTPGRTVVTPDYFEALGIRLVAGRTFLNGDRAGALPVAVINETMARMHWPGQDPIGRRVNFESVRPNRPLREPWTVIVGVVSDARQDRFETPPRPEIFLPLAQAGLGSTATLVVRAGMPPVSLMASVRHAIQQVDPRAPVLNLRTMTSIIDEATASSRYAAFYVGLLACLALMLAAGGIYSLGAFAAAQRTQEVAVRIALGAGRRDVLRLILAQALRPAVGGLAIGCVLALAATKLAAGHVPDVQPSHPLFVLVSLVILAVVAAAASYLPARRATRVDPLAALKAE
jgi:putative ABC transport system permease protein